MDGTCWRWVGNGTRMKLTWEKRKHVKASIRCVVSFFVFCQAILILVPFPAHRQQVPSRKGEHLIPISVFFGLSQIELCCEGKPSYKDKKLCQLNSIYPKTEFNFTPMGEGGPFMWTNVIEYIHSKDPWIPQDYHRILSVRAKRWIEIIDLLLWMMIISHKRPWEEPSKSYTVIVILFWMLWQHMINLSASTWFYKSLNC